MTNRQRICLAIMLGALTACSDSDESSVSQPASSLFSQQVVPLLQTKCATCHLTGSEAGSLSLVPAKAFGSLVDRPSTEVPALMLVKPGAPDESYLIMKLEGTQAQHGGSGMQMPLGAAPLSASQIEPIRKWILDGAGR